MYVLHRVYLRVFTGGRVKIRYFAKHRCSGRFCYNAVNLRPTSVWTSSGDSTCEVCRSLYRHVQVAVDVSTDRYNRSEARTNFSELLRASKRHHRHSLLHVSDERQQRHKEVHAVALSKHDRMAYWRLSMQSIALLGHAMQIHGESAAS